MYADSYLWECFFLFYFLFFIGYNCFPFSFRTYSSKVTYGVVSAIGKNNRIPVGILFWWQYHCGWTNFMPKCTRSCQNHCTTYASRFHYEDFSYDLTQFSFSVQDAIICHTHNYYYFFFTCSISLISVHIE